MKRYLAILFVALFAAAQLAAQPRIIVNIVVGSMRAADLERYADNFSEDGFRRLIQGGTVYTDARYDFLQTTSPVGLATLATGAMPSTHGVIGHKWVDYTSNAEISLVDGRKGSGAYHLIAPTLSETLVAERPESQVVTVAGEALSAVMLAGRGKTAFWLEGDRCSWTTSPYYGAVMPDWVMQSNRERYNLSYVASRWRTMYEKERYKNTLHRSIPFVVRKGRGKEEIAKPYFYPSNDLERLFTTPSGNTAILGFAKQVIAQYSLGADAETDILNIALDPSRHIMEIYGPESVEAEDMYYRLDRDLADFLTFLFAQVKDGNAVVVLTSDHGTSPSYDAAAEQRERFNTRQFEVIANGFLNVRYGVGDWVVDYEDKCLWLNHNLIYERGLDLADVQNEVAIFAMQFSGVSHALASTAMRTSYFGSGYARMMQNSYYPRRSGDVVLNLMPGWIEERDNCVSLSGSMYGYDTQVPLVFYGSGIGQMRIGRRVDMTSVAPTLSRMAGITEPAAAEGDVLEEIVEL